MMKYILLLALLVTIGYSKRLNQESYYQNIWCADNNGTTEVALNDKTRVDCVTEEYAIEFDFADKYAECIGQSLHYSILTGKQPACALILEHDSDIKYLERLKIVADKYGIKVFIISP